MRLVSFRVDGDLRWGALRPNGAVPDIVDTAGLDGTRGTDLKSVLSGGTEALERLHRAVERAPAHAVVEGGATEALPVIPNPRKIICIGLNYRDHAAELGQEIPPVPTVFAKYANCLIADGAPIRLPASSREVDYEAELAFVIGAPGRHIRRERAFEHIAGYTAFNDVTARDHQWVTPQWSYAKSFDSFGPLGPALVTHDEIPDPHDLAVRLRLGEEVLQDGHTRELIFSIPELVAHLSAAMTLEPGDVIATGTPSGIGATRTPPRFLRPGDRVQVEIEAIGVLTNPVVADPT